jgi:hypothetical protein
MKLGQECTYVEAHLEDHVSALRSRDRLERLQQRLLEALKRP